MDEPELYKYNMVNASGRTRKIALKGQLLSTANFEYRMKVDKSGDLP